MTILAATFLQAQGIVKELDNIDPKDLTHKQEVALRYAKSIIKQYRAENNK